MDAEAEDCENEKPGVEAGVEDAPPNTEEAVGVPNPPPEAGTEAPNAGVSVDAPKDGVADPNAGAPADAPKVAAPVDAPKGEAADEAPNAAPPADGVPKPPPNAAPVEPPKEKEPGDAPNNPPPDEALEAALPNVFPNAGVEPVPNEKAELPPLEEPPKPDIAARHSITRLASRPHAIDSTVHLLIEENPRDVINFEIQVREVDGKKSRCQNTLIRTLPCRNFSMVLVCARPSLWNFESETLVDVYWPACSS